MAIFIDHPRKYPWREGVWSHLWTDGPIEELHAFARRIGMKRSWFQDRPRWPHYDLTGHMPDRAIRAGAKLVTIREYMLGKDKED